MPGSAMPNLRETYRFFRKAMDNYSRNASIFPSSRFLVEAMLRPLPLHSARCVVEFGPGTGVMTSELLRRMRPDAHLHCIELDGDLSRMVETKIRDPRLRNVHGDAAELGAHLARTGCQKADCVLSSLGFSLMPGSIRERIMEAVVESLNPQGVFTQYTYVYVRYFSQVSREQGVVGFNLRDLLEQYFRDVQSEVVLLNPPPAVSYTCHGPRVIQPIRHTSHAA